MLTLGIETSCDETAVAVVEDGHTVRANVAATSVPLHAPYGGVVPEIACRYHVEAITHVIREALRRAECRSRDLDLIAVTAGPGLPGALLVGVSAAKALAMALDVPCIGVNHLQAHAIVGVMDDGQAPYVSLIVSGGHTSLVSVRPTDRWRLLGQTCDDAAGEAFDKVASLLGLGYPGGPAIERAAIGGDPSAIRFPRARCDGPGFDVSFSGLKTAVLYYLQRHKTQDTRHKRPATSDERRFISDVAASFQEAVVDVLVERTMAACRAQRAARLVLGGGVSANRRLRERMADRCARHGIVLRVPEPSLCVDNGVMVAALGERLFRGGWRSDPALAPVPDAVVTAMLALREAS